MAYRLPIFADGLERGCGHMREFLARLPQAAPSLEARPVLANLGGKISIAAFVVTVLAKASAVEAVRLMRIRDFSGP